MAIPSPTSVQFTYEDYLNLPEDRRYEIIDGELYMVPAPFTYHQKVQGKLFYLIYDYVEDHDLGEVFSAPIDILFSKTDVVQPDIIFIAHENMHILKKENVQGAPDLVVEVLSPSSVKRDYEIKMKLYSRFGVKEYWIADPDAKSVNVYIRQDQMLTPHNAYQYEDTVHSPLLTDINIPLQSVFE